MSDKPIRLHYLQHVPFENLARIAAWAELRGHQITCTRLFADGPLPAPDEFDWLFVMGGPMNIYEHEIWPWLIPEKKFIHESIKRGKAVLGVCLGAQLLADVLGAPTSRSAEKEIGWHPISLTPDGRESPLLKSWPGHLTVFHWHGDTFEIPRGAFHIAESEACLNQAFIYGDRIIGLQFHIEYTFESITAMLDNCSGEIVKGPCIQDRHAIISGRRHIDKLHPLLYSLLDSLESTFVRP